jgi:hypothetical protein
MKTIKTSFFRHWLAVASASLILVTGCTPAPVLNPCGDLVINKITVTSQPNDNFINLVVDFMNMPYNGQIGDVTIRLIESSKPIGRYQIYVSKTSSAIPADATHVYIYSSRFWSPFIGLGGTGDVLLHTFEKYSMTFTSQDLSPYTYNGRSFNLQDYPYVVVLFFDVDNDCNTQNNSLVINRFTGNCASANCY